MLWPIVFGVLFTFAQIAANPVLFVLTVALVGCFMLCGTVVGLVLGMIL